MFEVLQHPEHKLPTVINTTSNNYPEFIELGYEIIFKGTKKECLEKETEILENFIDNN